MRRYHLLLAGASWMAEYGDPDDPDDWEFISEVLAVPEHLGGPALPAGADHHVHPRRPGAPRPRPQDGRARCEAAGHACCYYENIEGGHGGAADNAQTAFKSALTYEFLHRTLQIVWVEPAPVAYIRRCRGARTRASEVLGRRARGAMAERRRSRIVPQPFGDFDAARSFHQRLAEHRPTGCGAMRATTDADRRRAEGADRVGLVHPDRAPEHRRRLAHHGCLAIRNWST